MEEPPLVADWRKLTKTSNVVVVPFFISDGLHSYEDIPVLLGIPPGVAKPQGNFTKSLEPFDSRSGQASTRDDIVSSRREVFRRNPYKIDGRSLFYAPSIGTDPGFADIIIEQAEKF
jgi:sirohydrochlorin cobaltochelatase